MEKLREDGIQTSIHYPPIHRFSYYRRLFPTEELHQTESVAKREVTLPLYPTMEVDKIEAVIRSVVAGLETRRHDSQSFLI
jgi:dTDP-4-amino-4,6-dideoxygalactose transaminase